MTVVAKQKHQPAGPGVGIRRGTSALRVVIPVLLLPVLVAAIAMAVAFVYYADRALPGVRVGGVDVSSLRGQELRATLQERLGAPWAASTVTATYDGKTWRTTNKDLGVVPDIAAAESAALGLGKSGTIADRINAWSSAFAGQANVPFTMRAEGDAAQRWVAQVAAGIDRQLHEGDISATPAGIVVTQPVIGRELDRTATIALLLQPETLGDREFAAHVRVTYPALDEAGMREAADVARALTTELEVSAGDRGIVENAAGLATLATIQKVAASAADLPPVPAGAIAPATRYRYAVGVNEDRVREWVTSIANELDRPARNASYTVKGDGTLLVIPSVDGSRVDQDALKAALLHDLTVSVTTPRRVVVAPLVADLPAFNTAQAARYTSGMARVSSFITYYPPSASRHANISTGAAQFNNIVISPGQTFSFWDLLGPVTVERGYAYAGAIIDNRSDENVIGGGLCQVSTTLFNAVASAGYQIVERHEHGYYIDRYPIGLDAAVFLPGVDMRWKNDTPYPVLIRSSGTATSVSFELFSIPTGRVTTFTDPVVTNFTDVPPGQPADPAFAPGYVDKGRDVVRTRTVVENGKVIHQDTWASHYVPVWGGPAR
ncbi:MAG: VanW family protein [Candidatus Limnocylindria bacterium]